MEEMWNVYLDLCATGASCDDYNDDAFVLDWQTCQDAWGKRLANGGKNEE